MALRLCDQLAGALQAVRVEGGDLLNVELGASGAASDTVELASVDQEAEVLAGDAQERRGLLGGEPPSAWLVGLHAPHGAARVFGAGVGRGVGEASGHHAREASQGSGPTRSDRFLSEHDGAGWRGATGVFRTPIPYGWGKFGAVSWSLCSGGYVLQKPEALSASLIFFPWASVVTTSL